MESMILSAAELREKTREWSTEKNIQDAAIANEIFENFYNDYILPEAKYGHYSTNVRNYVVELGLEDAGVRDCFFGCLAKLGYRWEAKDTRTSDTAFVFDSILTVSWDRSRCEKMD